MTQQEWFKVFDVLYGLPSSLPCQDYNCQTGCEPGYADCEVVLLPYEKEYIEAKTDSELRFDKKILKNCTICTSSKDKICPYFNTATCNLYKYRPIDCRVCPLVPTKITGELSFFVYTDCPIKFDDPNLVKHVDRWTLLFKILNPFLSDDWWNAYDVFPPPDDKIVTSTSEILEQFRIQKLKER